MADLKLVVFDVDGTLIDSQAFILEAMRRGFAAAGQPAPTREQVLGIVGLSLSEAVRAISPATPEAEVEHIAEVYRQSFVALREETGGEAGMPLYPGVHEVIARLGARDDLLLGVATGKARRGLDHALAAHGLEGRFATLQTSDHHPSKPHPAMLQAALDGVGIDAADAVMIGDTTFDMQMARNAGVAGVGVSWGYHDTGLLTGAGASVVIDSFDHLDDAIAGIFGQ